MKLARLLERLKYELIQGTKEIEIAKVTAYSKEVIPNSVFICITGMKKDGCAFVEEALAKGATAIVTEKEVELPKGITEIRVENTRIAMAKIAAAFYQDPSRELVVIGITGTKGKTTVSNMIYQILTESGIRTGLIGTIEIRTGNRSIPSRHTSPEALVVQKALREMVEAKCKCAVMEVSSQALKLHRMDEIQFDIAVFTNLGKDHIGKYEHKDFEEYKQCKAQLFRRCDCGIFNRDDPYWREMLPDVCGKVETFGWDEAADYKISGGKLVKKRNHWGMEYFLNRKPVYVSMPGIFNIYNSVAAYIVCHDMGVERKRIQNTLMRVKVKGRVEMIDLTEEFGFVMMIDYAHNAMSLQSVLEMIHFYNPKRIITIFGCGGGRAKERRYEMGEVAGRLSDFTIITSDNPREENPEKIIQDIQHGIERTEGRYIMICDRKEAVRYAMEFAQKGDVILLAGKGHEKYQEINGIRYHMDDRETIRELIEEKKNVRRYHY